MNLLDIIDGRAPDGFTRAGVWIYRDAEGNGIGAVARYDSNVANGERKKTYLPFVNSGGKLACKGFAEPRPLYGLDQLAERPDAPVLVVEGEATADAAAKIFEDHVVVTSPSGSKSAAKADWRALGDRDVVIWPDHDEPGREYARDVAEHVPHAKIVTVPEDYPDKWDLADPMPAGVTDVDLACLVAAAISTVPKANGKDSGVAALAASVSKVVPERPWPELGEDAYHGGDAPPSKQAWKLLSGVTPPFTLRIRQP